MTAASKNIEHRLAAMRWFENFLESHNLPVDKIFKAWASNAKPNQENEKLADGEYSEAEARKDLSIIIIKNLNLIYQIESKYPGISSHLYENYGIQNFARFSKQILLDQYKDREKSKPFGLVVASRDDWNGASYKEGAYDAYENLRATLPPDYSLKIIEAKSLPELARLLSRIEKKHNRKPEFVVWSGHGGREFMLGPSKYRKENYKYSIAKDDFRGKALERMQPYLDLFSKDTTMIIDGCIKEEDNNLAVVAAKAIGNKFIYPAGQTSVENFGVMKDDDGNLSFEVKYNFGIDTMSTEK